MNKLKEDQHSSNEPSALSQRIRECVRKSGLTAKDFAVKIGISPSAITKYQQKNSEPSITVASAMAKAANVPLQWLASGEGQLEVAQQPESTINSTLVHLVEQVGGIEAAINLLSQAPEVHREQFASAQLPPPKTTSGDAPPAEATPPDITARLCRFVNDYGGAAPLAKDIGLPIDRLSDLCQGATPTIQELQCLASNRVLSLDWLIAGDSIRSESAWSSHLLIRFEKALRNIDALRPPKTSEAGLDGIAIDPTPFIQPEGILDGYIKVYRELPPSRYTSEKIDNDSLDPVLREGDIAIFDMNKKRVSSGIYLIDSSAGQTIAKVQNEGNRLMASYLAHKSTSFEVDPSAIAGTAVWAFRRITLRDT